MTVARRHHRYAYTDYVALERESSTKHEFLDGEIYAMAGGTEEHSALAAEVLRLLGNAIGSRPCRVHTSDLRIFVEQPGLATFPDGAVICGALQQHEPSPRATAINPLVLVEVTSDSSEEYDCGDKVSFYKTIPSLQAYLIVSHRERQLTLVSRMDGQWKTSVARSGETLSLNALDTELRVDDVYRRSSVG